LKVVILHGIVVSGVQAWNRGRITLSTVFWTSVSCLYWPCYRCRLWWV